MFFRQILRSRAYEWCLACQHLISKNLVNQVFSKPAVGPVGSNPRTSLLLSNKFKHFFWFSFISGTVGSKRKASRTASSKEHECVTLSCSRQTCQNKASLINHAIGAQRSCSESGKNQNTGLLTAFKRFIFLLPSSCALNSFRASRKMPRSPRLVHKAPIMKARVDVHTYGRTIFSEPKFLGYIATHV